MSWGPTKVLRVWQVHPTSARTAHVQTDAGPCYLKGCENPEGPHILACELVGTRVARWFGLPTFDFAVLHLSGEDQLHFAESEEPGTGPAYVTRAETGTTWGGNARALEAVENPDVIAGLVILDTWILNCDRYRVRGNEIRRNHRNVFLSAKSAARGRFRLVAMDHTHAFSCGAELTASKLRRIELIKSVEVFGLFPEFIGFVTPSRVEPLIAKLESFTRDQAHPLVADVPGAWGWNATLGTAMQEFLVDRAHFLAGALPDMLATSCAWDPVLRFNKDEKNG